MKKKIVHQDDLIVVACGAVGYGGGLALAAELGLDTVMQLVVSFMVGGFITVAIGKLKEKLGKKKGNIYGIAFSVLCAIVMDVIGIVCYGKSIKEEIITEVGLETAVFGLAPAIIIFIASIAWFRIRRSRIVKKYGDGHSGYVAGKQAQKLLQKYAGRNQRLDAKALKGASYVKTKYGTYVGTVDTYLGTIRNKQMSFLGIPYAKAPVGPLRFKAPEPPDVSEEIFEAKYFGPSALQANMPSNVLNDHTQDEDCLYLNIWTTQSKEKNKPVMVYVPGGDINFNGGALPIYSGERFTKNNKDIIYVNINYRLAATATMDFSDVPGGESYKDASLLPVLDVLQALRWIKENIADFGGDPDNVTVVSDNSGSTLVACLAVSEKARGLFNRVMLLTCNLDLCVPNKDANKSLTSKLLKETGASSMEELLKLDQAVLKQFINDHVHDLKTLGLGGELLPLDLFEAYRNGKTGDIEFIFALPANEMTAWITVYGEEEYRRYICGSFDEFMSEIAEDTAAHIRKMQEECISEGKTEFEAMELAINYVLYEACSLKLAECLVKAGKKVRICYWNVDSPVKKFGPNTVSLICAMLGNVSVAEDYGYIYNDNLGNIVMRLVSNYVRNGTPELQDDEVKGMKGVQWPLFTTADRNVLTITDKEIKVERDFL